jgi:hypothetical protein
MIITPTQRKQVMAALERGVSDAVVAEAVGLNKSDIALIRLEHGVDCAELTRRQYAHWRRMLTSGWSLDAVVHVYGVKPNSVKLGLWNAERFSLVEAKKKSLLQQQALWKGSPRKKFSW